MLFEIIYISQSYTYVLYQKYVINYKIVIICILYFFHVYQLFKYL